MDNLMELLTPTSVSVSVLVIIVALMFLPDLHLRLERRVALSRKRKIEPEDREIVVTSIIVYPIKSCGGIKVDSSRITSKGLEHDRQWMLVDSDSGTFVSQRTESRMALIQPKKLPDLSMNEPLTLSAPGMPDIDIPIILGPQKFSFFNPSSWFNSSTTGDVDGGVCKVMTVKVWGEPMRGVDQGDEAAQWFEKFLNRPGLRLVKFPENEIRYTDPKLAKGSMTGYADGFPYLIISEESLAELNNRVKQHAVAMNKYNKNNKLNEDESSINMNQFRPNFVVKGGGKSFLEDQWLEFVISVNHRNKHNIVRTRSKDQYKEGVIMKNVKACTRCKMPTVNQSTGKVHAFNNVKNEGKVFHVEPYVEEEEEEEEDAGDVVVEEDAEPVRTLKQFRTGKHIQHPNPKWKDEIFFGVNLVSNRDSYGKKVFVGDLVTVIQKQDWVTWEK